MSRLNAALSSATQHAMPIEFGRKWGTECLNTRFPLSTLLCAEYSVINFNFDDLTLEPSHDVPVRLGRRQDEIVCQIKYYHKIKVVFTIKKPYII